MTSPVTFFRGLAKVATFAQWINGMGEMGRLQGYALREVPMGDAPDLYGAAHAAGMVARQATRFGQYFPSVPLPFTQIRPVSTGPEKSYDSGSDFPSVGVALADVHARSHDIEYALTGPFRGRFWIVDGDTHSVRFGPGEHVLHTHGHSSALPSCRDLWFMKERVLRADPDRAEWIYARPHNECSHQVSLIRCDAYNVAEVIHWEDLFVPTTQIHALQVRRLRVRFFGEGLLSRGTLSATALSPVTGRVLRRFTMRQSEQDQLFWYRVLSATRT